MRMHQMRVKRPQIWGRRQSAEMLEAAPVERAEHPVAAEEQWLDAEIIEPVAFVASDPYRFQSLEPDIEPPQKMRLRARHDAVAVDEDGFPRVAHGISAS